MAKITIYKDNLTERNEVFERLCMKTQEEMKHFVTKRLKKRGKNRVQVGDGWVYYEGTFPILLCAHMDTVHKELPTTMVYANGTLSSPQGIGGDDRCGIYMIFEVLKKYDCSVVFLEDEEIGCVGARKFASTKIVKELHNKQTLKYIIEFDRKDCNHAVTYDCANDEFDEFITKEFFKKETGTCSDISYIAPEIGCAAVNLSCGYYKEHHLEHWVNLPEMETIIKESLKLLERTKEIKEPFKYIEDTLSYSWNRYRSSYSWDDDYLSAFSISKEKYYKILYYNTSKALVSCSFKADTEADAVYMWVKSNPNIPYSAVQSVEKCYY